MLPHLGQSASQAIEDGVALAVLARGLQFGHRRRCPAPLMSGCAAPARDVIQAEARQNGLRYDSKYESLEQRDREIASSAFRKSLYDYYDVEQAAIATGIMVRISRRTPFSRSCR